LLREDRLELGPALRQLALEALDSPPGDRHDHAADSNLEPAAQVRPARRGH